VEVISLYTRESGRLRSVADRYEATAEQMDQTLAADIGALVTWTTGSLAKGSVSNRSA
jgi:hypothetical protein